VHQARSIIDEYIRTGLENNLTIRKMDLTHEKNIAALREAGGYFLPGFSFNARYTIARGGRTFDFPAGDMLNPLFQNITALNNSMAAINPCSLPLIPTRRLKTSPSDSTARASMKQNSPLYSLFQSGHLLQLQNQKGGGRDGAYGYRDQQAQSVATDHQRIL
jgi:hypothetical protein